MQEFASSKEDRSAQPLSPAEVKAITDKFDWNIFLGNLARIFHNQSSMCRSWLKAWQHLKRLALPSTPDLAHFNRVYAVSQGDFRNWCYTLLIALYDAG